MSPNPILALASLDRALDSVMDALTSGSAESLVATEADLAAAIVAVSDVARSASVSPADRPRLLAGLAHTRATLNRCRMVGTAVSNVVDTLLSVRGMSNTYDRAGKHARK